MSTENFKAIKLSYGSTLYGVVTSTESDHLTIKDPLVLGLVPSKNEKGEDVTGLSFLPFIDGQLKGSELAISLTHVIGALSKDQIHGELYNYWRSYINGTSNNSSINNENAQQSQGENTQHTSDETAEI